MATKPIKWKDEGDMHFAHTDYGMWTIEQRSVVRRGSRYHVTLRLNGVFEGDQDFGVLPTLAKAKSQVNKDHKVLDKLDR